MSVSSVTIVAGRGSPSRYLTKPRSLISPAHWPRCSPKDAVSLRQTWNTATRWASLPAVQKQLGSLRHARATMNAGHYDVSDDSGHSSDDYLTRPLSDNRQMNVQNRQIRR